MRVPLFLDHVSSGVRHLPYAGNNAQGDVQRFLIGSGELPVVEESNCHGLLPLDEDPFQQGEQLLPLSVAQLWAFATDLLSQHQARGYSRYSESTHPLEQSEAPGLQ